MMTGGTYVLAKKQSLNAKRQVEPCLPLSYTHSRCQIGKTTTFSKKTL